MQGADPFSTQVWFEVKISGSQHLSECPESEQVGPPQRPHPAEQHTAHVVSLQMPTYSLQGTGFGGSTTIQGAGVARVHGLSVILMSSSQQASSRLAVGVV